MTALHLHDTLTGKKRVFQPGDPSRVTMYVCGPTVWDYAHIGNMRPPVVFDVLFRLLRRTYGEDAVIYARNFTDIDDKIIAASKESGEDISVITGKFARIYLEDTGALGVLEPNLSPKATEHIPQMVAMTAKLVEAGHAYETEGHVLFSVKSFEDYGALGKRDMDEMIAGARVEVASYKRHPADFVLWKPSKDDEPGWDSPWGRGRPGWHLECSAMTEAHLGETIDIHGGGQDLVFPHHENEIAQSVCSHGGAPMARYWLHNGFLSMDAEKMSKSLGNVKLVNELKKRWPGEVLRYAMLTAHYRAPLDWTDALLEQATKSLDRLYGVLRRIPAEAGADVPDTVEAALADDLNTPKALSALFALAGEANRATDEGERSRLAGALLAGGAALGLLQDDPDAWFGLAGMDTAERARIDALVTGRNAARKTKDFAKADAIRDELTALGISVEDGPEGSVWRKG
ncbi:cysteine--tRNA ligase [Hyphobacterium marinum]|uniref:Cysteine--tRNA ligase n=1 Tax=Hyphobacterium marinum TaxID=3116574 RepID=A0ABU7LY29_9PROT|nr:cysteine--tRNA ligase [Hyphobacterium sp. Y6023]MEE2566356.1 cysteine--tRNA ligase [Hyphobacterium sp. Y6023]